MLLETRTRYQRRFFTAHPTVVCMHDDFALRWDIIQAGVRHVSDRLRLRLRLQYWRLKSLSKQPL